jgi:TonB family protein
VLPAPDEVFSSENPEVQAPVLVRPQLPRKPAPGDDTGIFEMIVDENGDVTLVNLISPRRNFHDRMLVAAAKAWKFKPATLDGQPVKYRIRIPIILTAMPGRS